MSSKEVELFHKRRATGIGGSDLGCIMGVSPWGTALDVWVSKRKGGSVPADAKESQAMMIGKMIEPTIAALFTAQTGDKVRKGRFQRHATHRYMIGHPDGMLTKRRAGVEYKNVGLQRASQFGDDGTDVVPPDYLLQCVHYMIVTNVQEWWLAALIGGNEFRVYRIPFNAELVAMVIDKERAFWQTVVEGTMPHAPRTPEQALALFPVGGQSSIEVDGKSLAIYEALSAARVELAAKKTQVDWMKTLLMSYMGENAQLTDISGSVLATWKNSSSNRLDVKALRDKHPLLAAEFTRQSTTRRFLLKGEKE